MSSRRASEPQQQRLRSAGKVRSSRRLGRPACVSSQQPPCGEMTNTRCTLHTCISSEGHFHSAMIKMTTSSQAQGPSTTRMLVVAACIYE
ncbi:TPA: hypothetical protein N0F65_011821 [Lagenidium giganteum]|uniref:Uncharacterized protein n=1 Tax=Lagenidium giganteum TaxID=4803 RepID=A0AAV2Z2V7_9STRA|nr:TPA: hypothetical protein N0F65_011821 [Lagenidium giganteum]